MSIRQAALDALADRYTDLRAGAIDALRAVLDDGTGTPVVPLSTLEQVIVDLDNRLVVVTDPASAPPLSLGVQDLDGDDVWKVHLVEQVDGQWTKRSDPVADLGELGAAIDDAGA